VLTGSYHNYFRIYDVNESGDKDAVLQADKSAFKAKKIGGPKGQGKGPNGTGKKEGLQTENIDFAKKIVSTAVADVRIRVQCSCESPLQLHGSWHPRENTIAVRNR
jgi:serine/threonine-protein phosphatase 2A regulatory subunit B